MVVKVTYQQTLALARDNGIAPRRCGRCGQVKETGLDWQFGYDDGRDPQYVGYQCRNCGFIAGMTRAVIVRRVRDMSAEGDLVEMANDNSVSASPAGGITRYWSQAQREAVESITATLPGTLFSGTDGTVLFLTEDASYVISVNRDGGTSSAYLVTAPAAEVAMAMDADEDEIGGWSTGWDA